jgi:hypothetical protein
MRLQVHGSRQAGGRLSVSSSSRICFGRLFADALDTYALEFHSHRHQASSSNSCSALSVIVTSSGTSSSRRGCRVTCRGFRFVCVWVLVADGRSVIASITVRCRVSRSRSSGGVSGLFFCHVLWMSCELPLQGSDAVDLNAVQPT